MKMKSKLFPRNLQLNNRRHPYVTDRCPTNVVFRHHCPFNNNGNIIAQQINHF